MMIDSNSTTQESYDMVVNRTARTWWVVGVLAYRHSPFA